MNPEDTIGEMDLPEDTGRVEVGFVDDGRRLRIEALSAKYKILEVREVMVPDTND